jgi:hypothetical protein
VIITALGIAAPFWLNAVSNVGVIGVFWAWRSRHASQQSLPAERVTSAIRTGYRHVRNNRHMRATLVRAVGFFLFASAYWALLPLVARTQLGGGPQLYGILLGAIGAGAIGGAFALPKLKAKVGANGLVVAGELGTAVSLIMFAFAGEPIVAAFASVIAGMCWIAVLASLNVSAQLALPDWVRGRGLAIVRHRFLRNNGGHASCAPLDPREGTMSFHLRAKRKAPAVTGDARLGPSPGNARERELPYRGRARLVRLIVCSGIKLLPDLVGCTLR